ncbi:gamma-aminobutyric acid type B receptor subunit 1-like [Ptychodera flava]|uniref:gamma-aminobutyric acid type B receptor subunit 1-like n=1 Tax=Ptychodera flava TaxID=63121 RepID=UPI003969D08F
MHIISSGLLILVILNTLRASDDTVPIHIGCMLPITGRHSFWAAGIFPAIELARRHVNNRSDILSGYRLEFEVNDTKSQEGIVMQSFIEQIHNGPKKLATLCEEDSDDSAGCRVVFEVGAYWNLVQISSMASTEDFSDRERFPNFFRTRTSLPILNQVTVALLKFFNWQRVSLLDIDKEGFHPSAELLLEDFEDENITIVYAEALTSQLSAYMGRLQALNGRINIVFFDSASDKPQVFCEAYKAGAIAPKYIWITITEHSTNVKWWENVTLHDSDENEESEEEDDEDALSCTLEEIAMAAEGSLSIDSQLLRTDSVLPVSGQM